MKRKGSLQRKKQSDIKGRLGIKECVGSIWQILEKQRF